MPDLPNLPTPINPKQSNPIPQNPLISGDTDFTKIKTTAPIQSQRLTDTPDREAPTRVNDPNQERREDRIKRENLLSYYDAEYNHAKRELDIINRDLKELENKIRAEEKEVEILSEEEVELKIKLKLVEKRLRRFRFELRVHKGDQMEKRVVQRRWEDSVKESLAKLKKIKYGDWKAIRK